MSLHEPVFREVTHLRIYSIFFGLYMRHIYAGQRSMEHTNCHAKDDILQHALTIEKIA